MRNIAVAVMLLVAFTVAAAQKDVSKRPSQPGRAEVTLQGKKISIDYSRPKIADPKTGQPRKIFGELVPYDKVWRTGANEATTLKTEADLDVGGTTVPTGTYTIFSIPSENGWQLIINKQTGQWGTVYNQGMDLARIPMKVEATKKTVDPFTIELQHTGDTTAVLHLMWENTDATVPLELKK